MARQAAGAVLAGAAAVCGMLLCGAAPKGKEEPDVRALRRLQVRDKDLPMAFVLPAPKKSAKGPARVKWVFAPVEDKKARTLAPVENERERLAKILEDVEAGKAKIDPALREQIERQVQICAAATGQINKFFNQVRIVVEDEADRSAAVVITAVEINREFKLEAGVAELKQTVPPWRFFALKAAPEIIHDKAETRFKNWEGWKLIKQSAGRDVKTEDAVRPGPAYFDVVHLCRRALKSGKVFMVEIYAHWEKSAERDQSFDAQVDALLAGLMF